MTSGKAFRWHVTGLTSKSTKYRFHTNPHHPTRNRQVWDLQSKNKTKHSIGNIRIPLKCVRTWYNLLASHLRRCIKKGGRVVIIWEFLVSDACWGLCNMLSSHQLLCPNVWKWQKWWGMAYFVNIPEFVKKRQSGRVGRHFAQIKPNRALQLLMQQSRSYNKKK